MSRYKVLVAEPSNVYQLILQQLLDEHDCDSLFDMYDKEYNELVELSNFDLICIAMELKDTTGPELCQKIRSIEGYSQTVPLVIITANENSATLENALRAGATEIFHKNALTKFSSFLRLQAFNKNYNKQNTGHILYVEDSPSQSSLVIASLSQQGHTLTHFSRAEDALVAFQQKPYDLVLTDIFLDGTLTN